MKPMFRREQRGGDAQRGAVDRGAADGRPVVVSQVVRKACALPRSERLVACRQAASLETRTSYHSMASSTVLALASESDETSRRSPPASQPIGQRGAARRSRRHSAVEEVRTRRAAAGKRCGLFSGQQG